MMQQRLPDLVTTNGHWIWFDDPSSAVIDMEDIRLSMANIRRYNGGLDWNLGRHVLLVSRGLANGCRQHLPPNIMAIQRGFAVAHDLHETYVTDLVNGMKKHVPEYRKVEDAWEHHVHDALALPLEFRNHDTIKAYDILALAVEMYVFEHPGFSIVSNKLPDYTRNLIALVATELRELAKMTDDQVWKEIITTIAKARHSLWELRIGLNNASKDNG